MGVDLNLIYNCESKPAATGPLPLHLGTIVEKIRPNVIITLEHHALQRLLLLLYLLVRSSESGVDLFLVSIFVKLRYHLVALIVEIFAGILVTRYSTRPAIREQLCCSLRLLGQFERATTQGRAVVVLEIRVRAEDRFQEIAALALLRASQSCGLLPGLWVVMRLISSWFPC